MSRLRLRSSIVTPPKSEFNVIDCKCKNCSGIINVIRLFYSFWQHSAPAFPLCPPCFATLNPALCFLSIVYRLRSDSLCIAISELACNESHFTETLIESGKKDIQRLFLYLTFSSSAFPLVRTPGDKDFNSQDSFLVKVTLNYTLSKNINAPCKLFM